MEYCILLFQGLDNPKGGFLKKVALIITRMIPGGASKVIRQIIEAAAGKYDLTLISGQEDLDDKVIKELPSKCKVVLVPSLVRNISPFKDFRAYREILCEIRKSEFDVIHTHTSKAGFIGRLAAGKAGVPVIIHSPHGSIYTEGSNIEGVPSLSWGKKLLQSLEKYAGKMTSWLTTLSEHEKEICIKLGLSTEKNTVVIHNGIECSDFYVSEEERKKARKLFQMENSDIVLLSIGRLSPEKGHAVLIDAFAKVMKRKPEDRSQKTVEGRLSLIIVGDGPEKGCLEKQVKTLMVEDLVTFAGHCDDVRKYLAAADIFLLPSLYEGFGIAVVEAMAARLPLIATSVGGVPEIISDGEEGLLVPSSDSEALSENIKLLVDSPEKRFSMGNAGKERAGDFTTEKMINKYFALYG